MGKFRHYKSTYARVKLIKALTEQYYEPGNNAKCYKAVWKKYIYRSQDIVKLCNVKKYFG